MKNPMNRILLFFFFLIVMNACNDAPSTAQADNTSQTSATNLTSGTQEMVALLQKINSDIGLKTKYFNNYNLAVAKGEKMKQVQDLGQQIGLSVEAANCLILANKNESAVNNLSRLLESVKQYEIDERSIYTIEKLLALAYLRLGEQQNCLQNTNDESCLFPINRKGVYAIKEGVNAAIQIYESLLAQNPKDAEVIWLLNFAYMTLGEFPDKVPSKWRLPANSFRSDVEIPKFKNVASNLGLNTMGLSGGVVVDDLDNDGYLDVMASSWGLNDQLRYFKNNGNGQFTEMTASSGLTGITGGLNLRHTDFNNDGFVDVLVLRGAWLNTNGKIPNSLLKNNGDGTFSDVTKAAGLLTFNPTQTATWADFNLDGWMDLFVGNESSKSNKTASELFINNGNGTFSNQTKEAGLEGLTLMVKGVTSGDLNNDGYPDLYLSVLGNSNVLFKNKGVDANGQVSFESKTNGSNTDKPMMSFPTWIWDVNNDGNLDIFVAAFGANLKENKAANLAIKNFSGKETGSEPKILINQTDFKFSDQSQSMGLDEGLFVMGSNFGDLNNDGFDDCYLGTGEPNMSAIVPNKMYLNSNGEKFLDVTTAGGFGHIQKGHAVGFGDMDNDGDQDVFCVLGGAFDGDVFGDALFLNPFGNQKNWVTLKLEGTTANRLAIGARVKLIAKKADGSDLVIHKVVSIGGSFGGNSLQLEVGLDDAIELKKIEVIWPNKAQTKTIIENVTINKFYKLKEGSNQLEELTLSKLNF